MTRVVGRAPGKLILLGEHAVVYGHPAIACAVSLGTEVRLTAQSGPRALGDCPIEDARLKEALDLALPAEGWRVDIATDFPVGRGMGSSAALSIALLRAAAAIVGEELGFDELHRRGFELERVFHGNPSGLDHAVSALGGAVLYRKGAPVEPIPMPPTSFVVLDTGIAGDTATLVAGVAARRPAVDPALERLGQLARSMATRLHETQALGEAMNAAQQDLRAIGVSTAQVDDLCALALTEGALGAKLSGAGGGGVVIALTPNGGEALLRAAAARGIEALACTLPSGH